MRFLLVALAVAFVFTSCEEENPGINFTKPEKPLLDTTYTIGSVPAAQTKHVLLFDITGVRCNNCPRAASLAKTIQAANPGRVIIAALYPKLSPDVLTRPWAGYDTLESAEATALISTFGSVNSLPTGAVDQMMSGGSRIIPESGWNGAVNTRLGESTYLNIDLNTNWLPADAKGRLELKVTFTQASSDPHLLYIAALENDIIGKQSDQDTAGGIRYYYTHNHAMRKLYTPPTGDTLKAAYTPGRVFEKHYYITPGKKWNPDNVDCLVWVVNAATKEIVHSEEIKLKK